MKKRKMHIWFLSLILISCFFTAACTVLNDNTDVPVDNAGKDAEAGTGGHGDIVIGYADLTHDGIDEKITVDISKIEETQEAILKILDDEGNIILKEPAGLAHAGWNSVYLCTIDDKDFLLRYNPYMIQGWGTYNYRLFSIDEQGTEIIADEDEIRFNITGQVEEFDIEKMASFHDRINEYLDKSVLLLSTEQGDNAYSTEDRKITRKEEYSWLYGGNTRYDENDSLKEKLRKYRDNIR